MASIIRIPEIAAAIDACTEIIPGMPATRANLKILLDRFSTERGDHMELVKEGPEWLDGGKVTFSTFTKRQGKRNVRLFMVRIYSAPESFTRNSSVVIPFKEGCTIDQKEFDFTEDGLANALAWAKERATRLKAESYCPTCSVDGARTKPTRVVEGAPVRPRKRLKISGEKCCVDCTIQCAVFGPVSEDCPRG